MSDFRHSSGNPNNHGAWRTGILSHKVVPPGVDSLVQFGMAVSTMGSAGHRNPIHKHRLYEGSEARLNYLQFAAKMLKSSW